MAARWLALLLTTSLLALHASAATYIFINRPIRSDWTTSPFSAAFTQPGKGCVGISSGAQGCQTAITSGTGNILFQSITKFVPPSCTSGCAGNNAKQYHWNWAFDWATTCTCHIPYSFDLYSLDAGKYILDLGAVASSAVQIDGFGQANILIKFQGSFSGQVGLPSQFPALFNLTNGTISGYLSGYKSNNGGLGSSSSGTLNNAYTILPGVNSVPDTQSNLATGLGSKPAQVAVIFKNKDGDQFAFMPLA